MRKYTFLKASFLLFIQIVDSEVDINGTLKSDLSKFNPILSFKSSFVMTSKLTGIIFAALLLVPRTVPGT